MEENRIRGFWNVKLLDENGNVKMEKSHENLVTDSGFDWLIQRGWSTQTGSNAANYIAIGSDSTSATTSDTTLGQNPPLANQQGTYSHTDGKHNFELTTTFAAGVGTGSINEYGLMNGSPTGTLFNHATFGTIVKNSSDTLQITFAGSLS